MAAKKRPTRGRRPRRPDAKRIREYLIDFAEANAHDLDTWGELRDSRSGTYLSAVKAAVAAQGDARIFREVVDGFMQDIRNNVDGLAEALECEVGRRGKYKIPSGISSARSALLSAIEHKLPLEEEDGDIRSFNAIRNDVLKANREARKKQETVHEKEKRQSLEDLASARKMLKKMTPEEAHEIHPHVRALKTAVDEHAKGALAIVEGKVVRLHRVA